MDWLRQSISYKGLVLSTVLQLSSLPATLIPDGLVACQVSYVHMVLLLLDSGLQVALLISLLWIGDGGL